MFRYLLPILFCCCYTMLTAQNVFKITTGATLVVTGNAVITLQDVDLDNDGTISQSGNTKFVFSGSHNSRIACAGSSLFDTIETAKTNNAVTVLQQNISIGSGLDFTAGLLDLNRFNILLQPGALLRGESENSRIIGSAGGYVQITSTLNAPSAVNPGNLGAIISTTENLGSTLVQRGHQSQTTGSGTGASIERYYNIIPSSNTALHASLRMEYFDAELNGRDKNLLTFWKSADNSHWQDMGFTTRDPLLHYAGLNGIADFSRWTLSDLNGALPLTLLYFRANCNNNHVQLDWKTANELNIDRFIVQRSSDGSSWTLVKTVPGKGDAVAEQLYIAADDTTMPGAAFYRLKILEKDGGATYSVIANSNCRTAAYILTAPNPVNDRLQLTISVIHNTAAEIKLFNSLGQMLNIRSVQLVAGVNAVQLNMAGLVPGIYELVIHTTAGELNRALKIVKQ
ncbi:MAG: T9SS type A sorting domain-containing protein [Bacteroidota bacterium]